jgi:hypothetical protein
MKRYIVATPWSELCGRSRGRGRQPDDNLRAGVRVGGSTVQLHGDHHGGFRDAWNPREPPNSH